MILPIYPVSGLVFLGVFLRNSWYILSRNLGSVLLQQTLPQTKHLTTNGPDGLKFEQKPFVLG